MGLSSQIGSLSTEFQRKWIAAAAPQVGFNQKLCWIALCRQADSSQELGAIIRQSSGCRWWLIFASVKSPVATLIFFARAARARLIASNSPRSMGIKTFE